MASRRHGTLYTGVTANLPRRAFEHREGLLKGFSAKYGCKILVWYELHETMIEAIAREKQIKAGSRAKKLALIEGAKLGVEGPLRVADVRFAVSSPRHREPTGRANARPSVIASGAKQSILPW
jgi:putative endonuclease